MARRYDSAGNPVGGEFQINTFTAGYQIHDVTDAAPNGDMAMAGAFAVFLIIEKSITVYRPSRDDYRSSVIGQPSFVLVNPPRGIAAGF